MKFIIFLSIFFTFNFAISQECGKIKVAESFISGGEYVSRGQFPWLAPLLFSKNDRFFCGSSIISKFYLLSASHCFKDKREQTERSPSEIYAMLGKFDLSDSNEPEAKKALISEIKIHPNWNTRQTAYHADIALLRLKDEIIFTKYIQPICLPESNQNVFDERGTVAGYGLSEQSGTVAENLPKFIEIESVTQEVCFLTEEKLARISSTTTFCAGEYGKNPCKGDSGSGFYVKFLNSYTIFGIVSAAITRECHENQFVIFTNVPKLISWIRDEIEKTEIVEVTLDCEFRYFVPLEFLHFKECYSTDLIITTPNVRISSITGGEFDDPKVQSYADVDTIGFTNENSIIYLPDLSAANSKFPNFKKFQIAGSGLKYVERRKLAKMPQLTYINFYDNDIEYFEEDTFDDLPNLILIGFAFNKIKVLPAKLLWKLPKLEDFWGYSNEIEIIPRNFFKNNRELKKVWMNWCKIKKIHVNFRAFPKLDLLDFESNSCIDEKVCISCGDTSFVDIQEKINTNCI